MKKENRIIWEQLKFLKLPYSARILSYAFIMALVGVAFIFLALNIKILESNIWIPLILTLQAIFIILQLWFIRTQVIFQKLPYTPYFIIITKKMFIEVPRRTYCEIIVKNEGEIAHRVHYKITIHKKPKLTNSGELHTIVKDKEISITTLDVTDFNNRKIELNLDYYDKVDNWVIKRYIKFPEDDEFTRI